MHIESQEPLQVLPSTSVRVREQLIAMGHRVSVEAVICGVLNSAEYLRGDKTTRAGSAVLAVGV